MDGLMNGHFDIDVIGAPTRVLVGAAAGDAGFLLLEQVIPPGYVAPRHRHDCEEEAIYVLEGQLAFADDAGEREVGPGGMAYAHRGAFHGFVNRGSSAARVLVVCSPGRKLEACFRDFDRAARVGDLGPDRLGAIAATHGIEIAPPA